MACLAGAVVPGGAVSIAQTCWQYSYDFGRGSKTAILMLQRRAQIAR